MQPIPLTADQAKDQEQMRLNALKARIENDFSHHAPDTGQMKKYILIREKAKELALLIVELTPVSREQSLALTELETSVFFANASIARNE